MTGARYAQFITFGQSALLTVVGAVLALLGAQADSIVRIMLGTQWLEAVPVFRILLVAGFFQAAGYAAYWVFLSKGLMRQNLYYSLATRPLMIVAILVGSIWGMYGVAIAYSASIARHVAAVAAVDPPGVRRARRRDVRERGESHRRVRRRAASCRQLATSRSPPNSRSSESAVGASLPSRVDGSGRPRLASLPKRRARPAVGAPVLRSAERGGGKADEARSRREADPLLDGATEQELDDSPTPRAAGDGPRREPGGLHTHHAPRRTTKGLPDHDRTRDRARAAPSEGAEGSTALRCLRRALAARRRRGVRRANLDGWLVGRGYRVGVVTTSDKAPDGYLPGGGHRPPSRRRKGHLGKARAVREALPATKADVTVEPAGTRQPASSSRRPCWRGTRAPPA